VDGVDRHAAHQGVAPAEVLPAEDGEGDVRLARELAGDREEVRDDGEGSRAEPLADEAGVEICAPMKNVYAIALGVADGLADRGGEPWHDLKAAVFAQAVRELVLLAELVDGRAETAFGLAGAGDLEVTGLSGRNKVYGARIGGGEAADEALAAMRAADQIVEGVPAADLAARLVDQRSPHAWPKLPLLRAVHAIVSDHVDPVSELVEAALPRA